MAGPLWLELVASKHSLSLYVTDRSGTAVDAKRANATATVHTDGKGTRIEPRPSLATGSRETGSSG